jgi:hypothetical protein
MVDVPINIAEIEVELVEHPPEVVGEVIEPLVSGALVILLVMMCRWDGDGRGESGCIGGSG